MKGNFVSNSYSKVVGAMSPIEWDEDGKPIRYSIFTEWGEDYLITNNSQSKRLKQYQNRIVEAYGYVHLNEYGEKFLNLKKVNLIGYPGSTPINPLIDQDEVYPDLPLHYPNQSDILVGQENDWDDFSYAI
ncbi:MAG: hypothetical protein ACJAT2_002206 [Bacteriovoracaceae bacterium]|jgi:hypothetical protein